MTSPQPHTNLPFEEAAEWFWTVRSTEPSAEGLRRWNEWLRNEDNRRAFDAVTRAWQAAEGLTDAPWPTAAELVADSAVDVVKPVRRPDRQWRRYAIAAGVTVLILGLATLVGRERLVLPGPAHANVHETGRGQHRQVDLDDGSQAFLGAKTAISVNYTSTGRDIVLDRGEALFQVAVDARRPFVVKAGEGAITAIGTAFNVRRDTGNVVVTVTEGKVAVTQRGSRTQLGIGQEVKYAVSGRLGTVHSADPQIVTAWRQGRQRYRGERLDSVVADVNRYSGKQIVFGDRASEALLFSGTVQHDQIEDWLRGLKDIFPIEVVETDARHILLRVRKVDSP